MAESDKELLEKISLKNSWAFEVLYKRYARLFQMWALRYTGDKMLTEDIVQHFWIIVWTSPNIVKTNDNDSAKDYLLRLFSYRMLDYIKSAGAQILGNEESLKNISQSYSYTHVFEELETNEIHSLINEVVDSLPKLTREVFNMIWEDNYSVKEASMNLHVSEKVIRYNYNKAIGTLKSQLIKFQSKEVDKLHPETSLFLIILFDVLK